MLRNKREIRSRWVRVFDALLNTTAQTDDDECADWFKTKQVLRQGRVLSTLLFLDMFFAAVVHIVLVRFSGDEVTMVNLIHLQVEE